MLSKFMEISNGCITGFVDGDGCFNIQQIHTKNNTLLISGMCPPWPAQRLIRRQIESMSIDEI